MQTQPQLHGSNTDSGACRHHASLSVMEPAAGPPQNERGMEGNRPKSGFGNTLNACIARLMPGLNLEPPVTLQKKRRAV